MKINFMENGVIQIDNANIIYRNFSGEGGKFNREGDRNFAVIIPNEEIKQELLDEGWTVKIKPPRNEDEEPFMYLPVKVKFNGRGPAVYVVSGENIQSLTEETIGMIDELSISNVNLDVRPYDWVVNGKEGRSAYLQSMEVIQNIDRFGAKYLKDKE